MEIIRGLHNLKPLTNSVVTIGNFDGVHIGHQTIVRRLVEKSKLLGAPSVLISFSPTPQQFFGQQHATLSNFKEKHTLLEALGLDYHLIINFNAQFSALTAEAFVQQVLLDKLNIKHCLIGDDFRFGAKRLGDFDLLKKFSKQHNFSVENTSSVLCNEHRASSSKIREFLELGELSSAKQMLGRDFSISGKIIDGQKKGRTIGFPTINIPIKRKISPVLGVFAVHVELMGETHQGVCNIGKRPTVGGQQTLLEVFLFNFDANVYGERARVIFKHKIRDEQKFDSFLELKQQIDLDTQSAKAYFKI